MPDDDHGLNIPGAFDLHGLHWRWVVVEKTSKGRERRRELGWRLTEFEAEQYAEKHGLKLEKVPGSEERRTPIKMGEGMMKNLGTKR